MASFAFGFGNFTVPQTLNAFEHGFVGIGGNLMVSFDEAVTIAGNDATLTVLGAVYSADDQAVFGGTTTGAHIFVGFDGAIVSADDDTIEFNAGSQTINNNGKIAALAGTFDAIELFAGDNAIYNSGAIEADGRAIQIDGSAAGLINLIVNSGTISGGPGDDFEAIVTNDADDRVINSGTINGDVLLGAGNDVFNGAGGTVNGTVSGGAGDDRYVVDDPTLNLVEALDEGIDTVLANTGFTLAANIENLNLIGDGDHTGVGNNLANIINGNIGDNTINGLGGDDIIRGGDGHDTLLGGSGNDRLIGSDGNDVAHGGSGDDILVGGTGEDILRGNDGDDNIFGGSGPDILAGGNGDDRLIGGTGEDALIGGMGKDVLIGGPDADWYVYNSVLESPVGAGRDRILQFTSAGGDRIDLSNIDADVNTAYDDGFTFIGTSAFSGSAGELRYVDIGANLLVLGDVDGNGLADFEIFVANTAALSAGDFVL